MPLSSERVRALVDAELARIPDSTLAARIRELLVPPYPVEREWDYGSPGQTYTCWTVLEHPDSNTGIAFCEEGFGPTFPWGLVFLTGEYVSIGMDSAWFDTLEETMLNSMAWSPG